MSKIEKTSINLHRIIDELKIRLLLLINTLVLCGISMHGQNSNVKELEINRDIYPTLKSLYGKIEVLDNRRSKEILIEIDTTGRCLIKDKYLLHPELNIQLNDFYRENIGSILKYLNKKILSVFFLEFIILIAD